LDWSAEAAKESSLTAGRRQRVLPDTRPGTAVPEVTTAFFLKKWLEHNTHTNPVVVAGAWSNDCAASQDFNQPQPTHS